MAELVNKLMEDMVPELQDLQRKGLFTDAEIKAIVKRRRQLEYGVHKRAATKLDFLKYIQYESMLDQLRHKRKRRAGITRNNSLSDFAGVRRIKFIYERMVRRYKLELGVWLQYIDFCWREGHRKALSKIFGRCLQFHSSSEAVWILAASFEFDENQNMTAARALMQKAIRALPDSKRVWHEYFRLELLYLDKVRTRHAILGIGSSSSQAAASAERRAARAAQEEGEDEEEEEEEEDEEEDDEEDDEEEEDEDGEEDEEDDGEDDVEDDVEDGMDTEEAGDTKGKSATEMFLQGAVPMVVFRNGVKAIPDDLPFRVGFLHIYEAVNRSSALVGDLIESHEFVEDIYEDIVRSFPDQELAWDTFARRHVKVPKSLQRLFDENEQEVENSDGESTAEAEEDEEDDSLPSYASYMTEALENASHEYEAALQMLPTPEMWACYVRFLLEQIRNDEAVQPLVEQVVEVCQRAADAQAGSPELYAMWTECMLSAGDMQGALAISKLAVEDHPLSADAWLRLIALTIHAGAASSDGKVHAQATELFEQALKAMAKRDDEDASVAQTVLWDSFIDFLLTAPLPTKKLAAYMKRASQADKSPERSLCQKHLRWARLAGGASLMRQVYKEMLEQPGAPLGLLRTCINMEEAVLAGTAERKERKAAKEMIDSLYRRALAGPARTQQAMWLDYGHYLAKYGRWSDFNALYKRAIANLRNTDAFVIGWQQLKDSSA